MLDFLRRFKLSFAVYNFFHRKELVHNEAVYRKFGLNKKYYSPVSSKDFKGIEADKPWLDAQNSKVALPWNDVFNSLNPNIQQALLPWSLNGYAILPGFFSSDQIDRANAEIDEMLGNGKLRWKNQNRIMFSIYQSAAMRKLGNDPTLKKILGLLLGKEVALFQSINFLHGSEQATHSDAIHMTTFPFGNMIAAWVAMEDISADAGPLHYYRGSHKLPYYMNEEYGNEGTAWLTGNKSYRAYEEMIANKIEKQSLTKDYFTAKKGDVLIWHHNLFHGGEPHRDRSKTRKSAVFHYFGKGSICYHEVTQRPALIREVKE